MAILLIFSFLFLVTPSLVTATAEDIRVIVTPNNTVIFLVGEDHRKQNPHPGGNKAISTKVTEIFKQAAKEGTGYRVFIERADSPLFANDKDDLLSSILPQSGFHKNCSFHDIEVRNIASAARYILSIWELEKFANNFSPEKKNDPESQKIRSLCKRRFKCDIELITLADVYEECNTQLAWLKSTSPHYRSINKLGALETIKRNMSDLKELVAESRMNENEAILAEAIKFQKRNDFAFFINRVLIYDKITLIARTFFNLVLLNKLLEESVEHSEKPILVISGSYHGYILEELLERTIKSSQDFFIEKQVLEEKDFDLLTRYKDFHKKPSTWIDFLEEKLCQLLLGF